MNGYDYCSSCGGLFDYLDLKPYRLKWYCKRCYKEILKSGGEEPLAPSSDVKMQVLYGSDYCSRCGKIFDYLQLRPNEFKWYCKRCYEEIKIKTLEV